MPDLTPSLLTEPESIEPARGRNAVAGRSPAGSVSISTHRKVETSVPRTPKYRCLTQLSYLSGRLAGLAGSSRYPSSEQLRYELGNLAAIAETVFVMVEGLENP